MISAYCSLELELLACFEYSVRDPEPSSWALPQFRKTPSELDPRSDVVEYIPASRLDQLRVKPKGLLKLMTKGLVKSNWSEYSVLASIFMEGSQGKLVSPVELFKCSKLELIGSRGDLGLDGKGTSPIKNLEFVWGFTPSQKASP